MGVNGMLVLEDAINDMRVLRMALAAIENPGFITFGEEEARAVSVKAMQIETALASAFEHVVNK